MADHDDVDSFLPLPASVMHVLVALADGEKHGYAIMRDVAELSGGVVRLGSGTLYGSIKRMLDQGLIEETEERPGPGARRPASALLPPHCARTSGRRSRERAARDVGGCRDDAPTRAAAWRYRVTALYRFVLRAYPARFRHEYGDAMRQVVRDQLVHDHRSAMRILAGELIDVARTAPRMRWESPMTRVVLIVVGATAAIAAAIATGPLSLVLIAAVVVALGLLLRAGRDREVEAVLRDRRWVPWAAVAIVTLGAAVVIAQLADGELSEVWWTVMALCLLVGIATAVVALSVALIHRSDGTASPRNAR